jgi:hypothetical protein
VSQEIQNYPGQRLGADAHTFAMQYVHGSEESRLDYERRYCDDPGQEYEHKRVYTAWDEAEKRKLRAISIRLLIEHGGHPGRYSEHCAACVLSGYSPKYRRDENYEPERDGPDYAGWARVYVEAQRAIPAKWRNAFADQGKDNRAYYDALGRSIMSFGVRFAS